MTSTILELFRKHGKPEHRKLALLVIQLACPSNVGSPFRFKSREDTKPVVNIFNAVAAPVEKDKGHVTVIDDPQAALTQSLREGDAPRLQQPMVHKIIRAAMEFAMFSGLIVETGVDGVVHIRSLDPPKRAGASE